MESGEAKPVREYAGDKAGKGRQTALNLGARVHFWGDNRLHHVLVGTLSGPVDEQCGDNGRDNHFVE